MALPEPEPLSADPELLPVALPLPEPPADPELLPVVPVRAWRARSSHGGREKLIASSRRCDVTAVTA